MRPAIATSGGTFNSSKITVLKFQCDRQLACVQAAFSSMMKVV
jgi:hypothetical protein